MTDNPPNIVMSERLKRRLLLALCSSLLAWPIQAVVEFLGDYIDFDTRVLSYVFIGGAFSVALTTFLPSSSFKGRCIFAVILCTILTYSIAVELAMRTYGFSNLSHELSLVVSGVVGAFFVNGYMCLLSGIKPKLRFWVFVLLAGFFGGLVFSFMFSLADNYFAMGYIAWQVSVIFALHLGLDQLHLTR